MTTMTFWGATPLLIAALAGFCGVALILFGAPPGLDGTGDDHPPGGDGDGSDDLAPPLERHRAAFAELKSAGVTGNLEVVDFGNGLGLGVPGGAKKGTVLMRVPEHLSLSVNRARSCRKIGEAPAPSGSNSVGEEEVSDADASLDCRIERAVQKSVEKKEISITVGFLVLLTMERRRGTLEGLEKTPGSKVFATLLDLKWQKSNGLFAIDEDEFNVFSVGTSMEGWQQAAFSDTQAAHNFIIMHDAFEPFRDVSLEEVRWAYIVINAYGQWWQTMDDFEGATKEQQEMRLFLLPLFLARPTPDSEHAVRIEYKEESRTFELMSPKDLNYGEEVFFLDPALSDASVLCYRGLWFTKRHRMLLSLRVNHSKVDKDSLAILDKYGCGASPLQMYVKASKNIEPRFIGCMRMLAMSYNASRLARIEKPPLLWMQDWPHTHLIDQHVEMAATQIAIDLLQQALEGLSSVNSQIRQKYGSDVVAARPTAKVREAETMILVQLLKTMKELQVVASNEYLFDTLRETQKKRKPKRSSQSDDDY